MTRQLHFNAFLMGCGHHEAAWRLPESDPFAHLDLGHWTNLAQTAERGAFDSVFLADSPALWGNAKHRPGGALEPTVLLTALAGATSRIGLIATASTSYNDPYNLARRFASLDHISGGRAGWNIVTTATKAAAQNFGLDDTPGHRERYRRAAEFVDVSIGLWDSWEDGAEIGDKATGVYADPARIHPVDFAGEYFRVRGPLNVPRSPQGWPLLVQAGSSHDGREFAARYAEAVFTAQQTLADAQEFYADLKNRARRLGRDPDVIKILPGLVPVIGSTEAEARALEDELEELIVPEHGLAHLAQVLEVPPDTLALDCALPDIGLLASARAGRAKPLPADRRPRPAGQPHRQAAHRPARRRSRAPHLRRDTRAGRRHHRGVGQRGRGRRVQRDARRAAVRAGDVRRPRDPDPAPARPVPHRVHRPDPARPLRHSPPGQPVRRPSRRHGRQ